MLEILLTDANGLVIPEPVPAPVATPSATPSATLTGGGLDWWMILFLIVVVLAIGIYVIKIRK